MKSLKPCLVLVHGFLGGSAQWSQQLQEWQSEYHIVAIDLPGYGLKHNIPAPTRIEDFAEAVLVELSGMGIQTFHLLGHSMGGMIVQEMTKLAGEKWLEITSKNGKKEGLETSWHINGQRKEEVPFKEGKIDGVLTVWHENGKRKCTKHFKSGIEHGIRKEWDEKGNKTYEAVFINGGTE